MKTREEAILVPTVGLGQNQGHLKVIGHIRGPPRVQGSNSAAAWMKLLWGSFTRSQ
jgi:hypothetical protein